MDRDRQPAEMVRFYRLGHVSYYYRQRVEIHGLLPVSYTHLPGEHREENDRIIRSLQEQKKDKGLLEMKVHGKDSLVTYEIYDKSGIMVYETMPLDEPSNDRMMIVQTVVIMFLACLIFGLLLSARITKQIKKPIDRLTAHIETIAAGNFIRDDSIEGEDDIGSVGCVVNDMALRIKDCLLSTSRCV